MVISISSDITLRGEKWVEVIDKFSTVLTSRPIYNVFLLSTAIGILHDKQKDNDCDQNLTPELHNAPSLSVFYLQYKAENRKCQ